MGKCPKCGSYDVDVSVDRKYTFECQECGRKWNPRKKKTAGKTVDRTRDVVSFYSMLESKQGGRV